jgi:competence protein ComEC
VFAVVALVSGLRFLLVRIDVLAARTDVRRVAAAIGAPLALGYADFAGGSGSAWRAAWMLVAAFTAIALARRPRASRTLAASFLAASVVDPLAAFDVSFLLSAAATAGLIALGQPLAAHCQGLRPKPLRWLALSIVATTSSMLPCTPLLGLMTPDLTLAGIFANVIAAPIGEVVALPACLLHPLLGWVPALERGAALVASGALVFVARIAHAGAAATALSFSVPPPGAWHLALLAVAAGGWLSAPARARPFLTSMTWCATLVSALAVVELASRHAGRPHGELRVQALDVEQGDALLVDLPDGRLMLIDGGGYVGSPIDTGRSVLLPVLRERRRHHIDIAVLSHPHPDHFGGLASALPELSVGELWDTGQGEVEGAGPVYASLLRGLRRRGVPLRRPSALCGAPRFFGAARLDVLAPCPAFTPGRDANDNSFVIRIALGTHAVLLTGDAEAQEEAELVARYGASLHADLLKVGHHGSRTSSSQPLLTAVRPSIATISCGVRNRYGHPHRAALDRLQASGSRVLRLDRSGSVLWRSTGRETELFAFALAR